MMKGTATVLLLLFLCHSCFSQSPCKSYNVLKNIEDRDINQRGFPILVDDLKLTSGWYAAPGKWKLLDRVPGFRRCGTLVPIYRAVRGNSTSKMCRRLPGNECSKPFYIKTMMCGNKEIYNLQKSSARTGYCFVNTDPCAYSPCAHGGKCRSRGDDYECSCRAGYTGRNCTGGKGQPCKSYSVLKNIENRDPSKSGNPQLIDDFNLKSGWYAAPDNWKLLDKVPDIRRCGTLVPIYRAARGNSTSRMCHRTHVFKCSRPFYMKTMMCGKKEIYYLQTDHIRSGFCFVNTDPCAKNPCANGGTCGSKGEDYECSCRAGFTGQNCTVRADPCAKNPCANGGTCGSKGYDYRCFCAAGFAGRNCTECNRRLLDILIMEDVSRSVGKTSFEEVRRFEQELLGPFPINHYGVNVAYMVFSTNARVEFTLSEYSNSKSSVLAVLKNQTFESGSETNIDEAINVAVNSVFTLSKGDRLGADNVVIMFTDGFDTESKREDIDASISQLHAKAEVYVVALSNVEANSTVNSLASNPGNIFQIGSNATVSTIQSRLRNCKSSK